MGQRIHDTPHIIDGVDINEIPTPEPNKPIPFTHPIYRKLYPHAKTMSDLEKGQLLYTPEQYTLAVTTHYDTGEYPNHVLDPILENTKARLRWAALDITRIPPHRRWQVVHTDGTRREYPHTTPNETPSDPNNIYMGDFTTNLELEPEDNTRKNNRKLFISNLYGQHLIWNNRYIPLIQKTDATIGLGNYIRLHPFHTHPKNDKDPKKIVPRANNKKILDDMRILTNYPTHPFIRVIGANEIIYLNMTRDEASTYLPQDNVNNIDPIRDAWLTEDSKTKLHPNERLQVAIVVDGQLVTHAGLSYGEWVSIGSPASPIEAADRLNEKYAGTLYQGPCYMLGDGLRLDANPIFAHPQLETYVSWAIAPLRCPFDQVHGSSSMSNRLATEAYNCSVHPLAQTDTVFTGFGSITNIRGTMFTAVDPGVNAPTVVEDLGTNSTPYVSKTPWDLPGGLYVPQPVVTPEYAFPDGVPPVVDPLTKTPEG